MATIHGKNINYCIDLANQAEFAGVLCGAALAAAHDAEKELSYLCDYEIEEHREKFEMYGGATDTDVFDMVSDDEMDDY